MLFFRIRLSILVALAIFLAGVQKSHAIVAGEVAASGEIPSMAALIRKGSFVSTPLMGGGALVGDQWVITAAHTLVDVAPGSVEIWLGTTNLNNPAGRIVRNVLAIYRNPNFSVSDGMSEGDLALLLLDQPVSGIPILPVLDDLAELAAADSLRVSGFGTTESGVLLPSPLLLKADAEIITPMMAPFPYDLTPQSNLLAAIDPDEESTPCRGDSGGPLTKNIGGADTLVGIVSFGSADCDPTVPSVYTNVAFYSAWIEFILSQTAMPPGMVILGKNRPISNGDASPRKSDATDFGKVRRRKTRTFTIANGSSGLLTIRSAAETHRDFSIRSYPATIVGGGGATSVSVSYKTRKRGRSSRAWVQLLTNDPAAPIYTFRVAGRGKRRG